MVEPRSGARPGEPTVDDRLKRWARSCLAEGFFEQWDGPPLALELGKEHKSLGAQGASWCLLEEAGENRAGARPFPCPALRPGRSERAAIPVGVRGWWRQPKRVLGKLGGSDRGATGACEGRRVFDKKGDVHVGPLRGKREMAGSVKPIREDQRETFVCAPSLVGRHSVVDDRCEQRMTEASGAVRPLDHSRCDGAIEGRLLDSQARKELCGWTADGCCQKQRLSSRLRERVEACSHQSLQGLGDSERLGGVDVRTENPRELERVKRVPARCVVHTQ